MKERGPVFPQQCSPEERRHDGSIVVARCIGAGARALAIGCKDRGLACGAHAGFAGGSEPINHAVSSRALTFAHDGNLLVRLIVWKDTFALPDRGPI